MENGRRVLLLICLIGAAAVAVADQAADWKSLVDTEKAFARTAADKGIRSAFLEYLAGGALIFRPAPTPGRPYYEKLSPSVPTVLAWRPEFAEISSGGDLGYTSGPYEVYKDRSAKKALEFGHYVTIWQKQRGGDWKAVLDIGVSHPASGSKADEVGAPAEAGPAAGRTLSGMDLERAKQALQAEDVNFSKRSETDGLTKALQACAAERLRLYRQGELPRLGLKAALKLMSGAESPTAWTPGGSGMALSGDLGYTFGTGWATRRASGGSEEAVEQVFSYLHIWRRADQGPWRVVLDLAVPHPQR